jgi:hypothetical protein
MNLLNMGDKRLVRVEQRHIQVNKLDKLFVRFVLVLYLVHKVCTGLFLLRC